MWVNKDLVRRFYGVFPYLIDCTSTLDGSAGCIDMQA